MPQPGPVTAAPPDTPFAAAPMDVIRLGIIGVGRRGRLHLRDFLQFGEEVEVKAICDISVTNIAKAEAVVARYPKPMPVVYLGGKRAYERMCAEEALDLVLIATPWELHTPMALTVMANDKHVGIEVPAAVTLEECWQLVEAAETYQKHCIMLENVNYAEMELLALNIVRQGVLGEIVHCEGGYLHDLRFSSLDMHRHSPPLWRAAHHLVRNGNLYPTHGLGPLA
jgi:predicted dehydrogenase